MKQKMNSRYFKGLAVGLAVAAGMGSATLTQAQEALSLIHI